MNSNPNPFDNLADAVLLSQWQLSDFGLAIWGPTDSTHVIHGDVVGTFGYIAPEYFMRGRVSDKIDVYSLGVVLLELLSGRKPIGSETSKGQRSLVKWVRTYFSHTCLFLIVLHLYIYAFIILFQKLYFQKLRI